MNEEKRNLRRAIILIIVSLVVLSGLFFFGISLSANVATFFTNLKQGKTISQNEDTTPPGPPHLLNLPQIINQQNLEISGSSEPEATITISVNAHFSNALADKNGNFVFTVNLDAGENKIYAKAKDYAGNESQLSDYFTVIYDNKALELKITSPNDGTTFYGNKQRSAILKGETKPGSSVTVNERLVRLLSDGTFSYQYSLASGENILNFKATDLTGNTIEKKITLYYSE